MRLNLGCGERYRDGYKNIDIAPAATGRAPDILCDLRKVPLPDGCADEAMAIHVFEHFFRWEVDDVLREWNRLLKSGGLLVLEMPDVMKCAKALIENLPSKRHPDQLHMWGLYGDPRFGNELMHHKWGWHPASLTAILTEHGFVDIVERETQWHPIGRGVRDMRMEARKP